jgi:hypothetical protein
MGGVWFLFGAATFQSSQSLRPIKPPVQWVPINVFLVRGNEGVTTNSHLEPSLRKNGALPPQDSLVSQWAVVSIC